MFIFVGTGTSSWVSVAIFVASIIIPRLSLDYSAIWRRAVFCFRLGCLAVPAMAMARANSLRDFDPREWSANARGAIALILLAALPNLTMYPAIWSRAFILPAQILVRWGVAVPMLIACLAAFGYWDWRQCCHWLARCVRRFLQDIGPLFGPNNGFEQASTMNAAGIAKLALRLNALPLENFCPAEDLHRLEVRDLRKRLRSRQLQLPPGTVEKSDLVNVLQHHHSAAQTQCVICLKDFSYDRYPAGGYSEPRTKIQRLRAAWLRWRTTPVADAEREAQEHKSRVSENTCVSQRFLAQNDVLTTDDSFNELFRVPGTDIVQVPSETSFVRILEDTNRSQGNDIGSSRNDGVNHGEGSRNDFDLNHDDMNTDPCTVRVLPCSHVFHIECIDQWVFTSAKMSQRTSTDETRRASCPLCNMAL